ncbi:hypothetical protein HMPREF9458_00528 [Eggerthella lenta 1_1_60AFAA]|uniref:Uncharacterized protein n=1 Tax=Eggerthella lenta TaxID=84112 RepID=A0A6N2YLE1_EGGLN|nr:hypothetical protein HMPREF9458_00528 [Eggerthella lenta 1_1_60AFAA]
MRDTAERNLWQTWFPAGDRSKQNGPLLQEG